MTFYASLNSLGGFEQDIKVLVVNRVWILPKIAEVVQIYWDDQFPMR